MSRARRQRRGGSDMIAPLGRRVYPAARVELHDPIHNLARDIAKDPEGHHWRSAPGDRRVPLWHGASVPPVEIVELLDRMLRGSGLDPTLFSLIYSWYTDTFDFLRWIPSIEDVSDRVGQLVFVPVELDSLPAHLGWDSVREALLGPWQRGFRPPDYAERQRVRQQAERQDAELVINRLAPLVAGGDATGEQIEQYEAAVNLRDGSAADEWLETAKDARPVFKQLAEEMG